MNIALTLILFFFGIFLGAVGVWVYSRYPDGDLIVKVDQNGLKSYILDLDMDPYYIDAQKSITFRIVHSKENPVVPKPPKRRTLWSSQDKHPL
jgi:hypothetical protein